MKHNILIVTDHSTHVASNSLYHLSIALHADERSDHIWVCSRGLTKNRDFFEGVPGAEIWATPILPSFQFDPSGDFLRAHSVLIDRSQVDAILLRMPQPLNKKFLLSLEGLVPVRQIINQPAGTILTSSKEFLLNVAHLCPSPSLCLNVEDAVSLSKQYEIVMKPLYSYGGRGIVRLSEQYFWMGVERFHAEEIYKRLDSNQFPMLAMRYLKNVSEGDKRTIVVNRKVLGSAVRMPAAGSWICNVAQGGHAFLSEPDEDEMRMEQELTPLLFDKGVIFYGFDTLVDDDGRRVLSEINTLSIGGLGPIEEMSGRPLLKESAMLLLDYLDGQ